MKRLIGHVAIMVFIVGWTARGIEAQNRLEKYEAPAAIRAIDWLLLQANLRLIHDIDIRDRDKAEVPFWHYDKASHKIRASVRVSKEAAQGSLSNLRSMVTMRSVAAFVEAQQWIPELKKQDAEIVFFHVDWNPDGSNLRRVEFASYKDGEITFR